MSAPIHKLCDHWIQWSKDVNLAELESFSKVLRQNEEHMCIDCKKSKNKSSGEWLCLTCLNIRCGRKTKYQHGVQHYEKKGHILVIHLNTAMIWCYECDDEVKDRNKNQYKNQILPQHIRELIKPSKPLTINTVNDDEEDYSYEILLQNKNGGFVGLSNLGNTCFLNSGLQALLHCPPVIAVFARLELLSEFNTQVESFKFLNRQQKLRASLAEDMQFLVRRWWSPYSNDGSNNKRRQRSPVIAPREFIRGMVTLNPYFDGYQQHDSQEFVRSCLDNLHESLKLPYTPKDALKPNGANLSMRLSESIIGDIFQGELMSQVTCMNCNGESHTHDAFYDISIELPKKDHLKRVHSERGTQSLTPQPPPTMIGTVAKWLGLRDDDLSLQTCLHAFCTSEELILNDQYNCEKCKKKVNARKVLSFSKLPEILCIHIKRFSHNSYFGSKLSKHIKFPLVDLDMAPFLCTNMRWKHNKNKNKNSENKNENEDTSWVHPNEDTINNVAEESLYDLSSIVVHMGSAGGGHYIAYCRHHVSNKWFKYDDQFVDEVNEDEVLNAQAYILFYRRKNATGFNDKLKELLSKVLASTPSALSSKNGGCYLSKRWLLKSELLNVPGPIDNRDLCCAHGTVIKSQEELNERAVLVSEKMWNKLIKRYGGGPLVKTIGDDCEKCQLPMIAVEEGERLFKLNEEETRRMEDKENSKWFLIDATWLKQWKNFVNNHNERPGPISNHLLYVDEACKELKQDLKVAVHYRGLYEVVWRAFFDIYGGGPEIVRSSLDIYEIDN